jgi:exportin-7
MTDVSQFERVATLLYVEGKPSHVAESIAGVQLPTTLDSLPLLKTVILTSHVSVAVFLGSQLLKRFLSETCNALSPAQLEELTTFLTETLQQRGLSLEPYVVNSLVSNLTFVVVQGLLESAALVRFPANLAAATRTAAPEAPPYARLVLAILESLVVEVGQLNPRRTLAIHRRIAATFRDSCLLDIFTVAVESVEWVLCSSGRASEDVTLAALRLTQAALSFDFVCMFPDDGEDSPTASIPSTWRPILCKTGFFDMFWCLFENLPRPHNVVVLQCLIQLCSARRSLFQTDEERKTWLVRIMEGTMRVVERHTWLDDEELLREFCRLLNRIKPNYQLNELLEVECYGVWIRLMADFTTRCFTAWRSTRASFLSLCCMWARLLGSQEFSRKDKDPLFDSLVPHVTMAYLRSCMELGEAAAAAAGSPGGGTELEHPLDDDSEAVRLELDFASQMLRSCLPSLAKELCNLLRTTVCEYEACVVNRLSNCVIEEKLAWLLFLFGSLCKTPPQTDCEHDAEIIMLALRGIQTESDRLALGGLGKSILRLELGCLHFLHNFRKTYVRDPNSAAAKVLAALQDKLSLRDYTSSEFQQRLLLFFITKIVCNLRQWACSEPVLNLTLLLFTELASAFSSGKHLLGLDPVRSLLSAGESHPFPFQQTPGTHRVRVKYFRTLSSIFFLENVTNAMFSSFLKSVDVTLSNVHMALTGDRLVLRQPLVRDAIVGCFCDLRGVVLSCLGRRHFHLLYDFLSPLHLDTIRRLVEEADDNDFLLEVQALRLAVEICNNRCQRIHFDTHSIGGILLFRFGCNICCCLGTRLCRRLAGRQIPPEAQHWLVKLTGAVCALGYRCLTGGYCNFGVFELYGDPVLQQLLHVLWAVLCSFSLEDVRVYPKLAVEYFGLLAQVLTDHAAFFLKCPAADVMRLLRAMEEALRAPSLPQQVYTASYGAVEALTARMLLEARLGSPPPSEVSLTRLVSSADDGYFVRLLGIVFHNIVHDDGPYQSLLSTPLYLLTVLCPAAFDRLVSECLAGLTEEKFDLLRVAFERLLTTIPTDGTAETKPPDGFSKCLTSLRGVAKNIL